MSNQKADPVCRWCGQKDAYRRERGPECLAHWKLHNAITDDPKAAAAMLQAMGLVAPVPADAEQAFTVAFATGRAAERAAWQRTFDGHVYVPDEEYDALCAEARKSDPRLICLIQARQRQRATAGEKQEDDL